MNLEGSKGSSTTDPSGRVDMFEAMKAYYKFGYMKGLAENIKKMSY